MAAEISDIEFKVSITSVTQMINDLINYMRRQPHDIVFRLVNSNLKTVTFKAHSFVFMARSKWFFKGYKNFLSSNQTDTACFDISHKYDDYFNKTLYNGSETSYKDGVFTFVFENVNENAFKELINFMYACECKVSDNNITELLKLATMFEVSSLKESLTRYFLNEYFNHFRLDENNEFVSKLIELFYLTEYLNDESLAKKCIDKINEHDKTIINSRGWKELIKRKPNLVLNAFNSR